MPIRRIQEASGENGRTEGPEGQGGRYGIVKNFRQAWSVYIFRKTSRAMELSVSILDISQSMDVYYGILLASPDGHLMSSHEDPLQWLVNLSLFRNILYLIRLPAYQKTSVPRQSD
jgi:hypothetical protein